MTTPTSLRKPNGVEHVPAGGDPLDDCLVDLERIDQDLGLAQKVVAIHQPEQWPTGRYCRNDHSPWPCRLYRWGHQVLWLAGWRDTEISALVARAKAGDLPWA